MKGGILPDCEHLQVLNILQMSVDDIKDLHPLRVPVQFSRAGAGSEGGGGSQREEPLV